MRNDVLPFYSRSLSRDDLCAELRLMWDGACQGSDGGRRWMETSGCETEIRRAKMEAGSLSSDTAGSEMWESTGYVQRVGCELMEFLHNC
jgi:hypothetical protein